MSMTHHIAFRPPFPGCGHRAVRWFAGVLTACVVWMSAQSRDPAVPGRLSQLAHAEDESFLEEIQTRAFLFFLEQSDAQSGLTRDRAPADGGRSRSPASIAATGFALTAWC